MRPCCRAARCTRSTRAAPLSAVALQACRDASRYCRLVFAQALRQHGGVLDRHACALGGKRQHRVRGVAQQCDRAVGPFAEIGQGE